MRKVSALVCFLILLIAAACAVNPVTGKRELSLISEQHEISLGKETDVEIKGQYGIYNDPSLIEYVSRVGQTLTPYTHRPHLTYHFAILDTPVVNAFAVPGGYIYVTRGMLAMMNTEAELAVVLGHELGHVNARHSVKKLSQLLLVQLGLAVGSELSETFSKISGVASLGIQLLFLKFSRDDERQADELGVDYSRRGGYNPSKMINFFSTLQNLGDLSGGHSLPGFLSTHPLTSKRIQNTRALITEGDHQLKINKASYLNQIKNIVYGIDPRQGYVEGNTFYHPLMRFYFSFPKDWNLQNTTSRAILASKDGNAAVILQAEKSSETLESYAQKKASTIEGRQFIKEDSVIINGMSSFQQLYDIVQQDKENLRIGMVFINKNPYILTFSTLCTSKDFNNYRNQFGSLVGSFNVLRDEAYLNRQPKRIRLHAANGRENLMEIFQQAGMVKDLWPKFSVMNGMELHDIPKQNQLIKIVK